MLYIYIYILFYILLCILLYLSSLFFIFYFLFLCVQFIGVATVTTNFPLGIKKVYIYLSIYLSIYLYIFLYIDHEVKKQTFISLFAHLSPRFRQVHLTVGENVLFVRSTRPGYLAELKPVPFNRAATSCGKKRVSFLAL